MMLRETQIVKVMFMMTVLKIISLKVLVGMSFLLLLLFYDWLLLNGSLTLTSHWKKILLYVEKI